MEHPSSTSERIIALEQENKDLQSRLEKAEFLAYHDGLTGLPNKHGLERYIEEHGVESKIVLFFDSNNFGKINKIFGHTTGDTVIKELADVLHASMREKDFLARLGGDEFVAILDNASRQEDQEQPADAPNIVSAVQERVFAATAEYLTRNPAYKEIELGMSIGAAIGNESSSFEELRDQADANMRAHKTSQLGNHALTLVAPATS